jgi:predicted nucleic acid-binding protein
LTVCITSACVLKHRVVGEFCLREGIKTGALPDFLIGAHTQASGYTLLTRDVALYKKYFPELALIHP